MSDVDTSREAVERMANVFELPRDVYSILTIRKDAWHVAATLCALLDERDELQKDVAALRPLSMQCAALSVERDRLRGALLEIKKRTQDAHPMSYVSDYWRIANAALGENNE